MLPTELKLVLTALITYAVTEGLKVIGKWVNYDLTGSAAAIAASLTGALVMFADTLLATIPAEYQPAVGAAFGLLIALLGAFGVHAQIKKAYTFGRG